MVNRSKSAGYTCKSTHNLQVGSRVYRLILTRLISVWLRKMLRVGNRTAWLTSNRVCSKLRTLEASVTTWLSISPSLHNHPHANTKLTQQGNLYCESVVANCKALGKRMLILTIPQGCKGFRRNPRSQPENGQLVAISCP